MSKRADKPKGYYFFLENKAKHEKRSEELMAALLTQGLFGDDAHLNIVDQAVINQMAEHALVAMSHGGWEMMFGDNGEYRGVVT